MKVVLVSFFISFIVAGVFSASVYDEKQEAEKAVENKFKEVEDLKNKVNTNIEQEKNIDSKFEQTEKEEAQKRKEKVEKEFNENKIKTTRTAIVKGKPASAIECIAKVGFEAEKAIPEVYSNFEKILIKFKENRLQDLNLQKAEIELILTGLQGLKVEVIGKIQNSQTGVANLRTEFLKRAENAEKQLNEIDQHVTQFNIKNEYKNLRTQNEIKNKDIGDSLLKSLQKCT